MIQNEARDVLNTLLVDLFNDILNDYWVKSLSDEERLFYYPLYLWWQITAVVPLSVLTPKS